MVGHLEGQGGRLGQDRHVRVDDLDLAGGQRGVRIALRAHGHGAGHGHDRLVAQLVRDLLAHDDLDDAGGVPEVDERDSAVVTAPVDPPREGDGGSGVRGAQGAG